MFTASILLTYWHPLLTAMGMTLVLSGISSMLASACALALVILRKSDRSTARYIALGYLRLVKTVPPLVLIVWTYYALPLLLNLPLSPFAAATIALGVTLSPFLAEAILAAIQGIPLTQFETARLCGFSTLETYIYIILPQAVRNAVPDLCAWFITQLKLSSLASIIGLGELMHVGNIIISTTFLPFEVYTTVALCYMLLILGVEQIFQCFFTIHYRQAL